MLDSERSQLLRQIAANYNLASPQDISDPPSITAAISGLQVRPGFVCTLEGCDGPRDRLSIVLVTVQRQRSRVYDIRYQRAVTGIGRVQVQTFFAEPRLRRLFVVEQPAERPTPAETSPVPAEPNNPEVAETDNVLSIPLAELEQHFERRQRDWQERSYGQVPAPGHQSQDSPWILKTGFRVHLEGFDKLDVLRACAAPGKGRTLSRYAADSDDDETTAAADSETGGEAALRCISEACVTLFQKAHAAASTTSSAGRLNTRHARILNTLELARPQSKPFRQLAQPKSLRQYTDGWTRFLCYVLRLTDPDTPSPLARLMRSSEHQAECVRVLRAIADDVLHPAPGQTPEPDGWLTVPEQAVLEISMGFLRHDLRENVYDSALLSYVAARAMKMDGSWKAPTHMTSFLAGLTYIIQLTLFTDARLSADQQTAAGRHGDPFERLLRENCDRWLVNSQATPSAEILNWRLYAQTVASSTLPTAYTSWSLDGETVTYRDSILTMTEWRTFIRRQLDRAEEVLHRQLLYGQDDRPRPRARNLLDVETETRPGYNFTQDPRNRLGYHAAWLLKRLVERPEVPDRPVQVTDGRIRWRSSRVHVYLGRVTDFLEHLLVLVHLTGGLPGRAPEIVSLRACNDEEPRNVMIHDGQVMFITGYHKMQYVGGSRLVCRFLPAAVGDLLVTYLAMVLPFVRYLEMEFGRTTGRSHLFSDGPQPWKDERLTRILRRETAAILGQGLVVKHYRHLAIAIDRRHLRRMGGQAMNLTEDGEIPTDAAEAQGDVVNDLQASHSTFTGNQSYANSVRTGRIFNDPKLNQFRHVSLAWHDLAGVGETAGTKRNRGESVGERLALRPVTRKSWSQAELRQGLVKVHGDGATARTEGQWDALSRMAEGQAQLAVVMPTGGGKSLLFQLGSVLPGAGVTVVILPLVVLKQDLLGKCAALGLSHTVWTRELDVDSACAPLVLVGVEDACSKAFLGFMRRLQMEGTLDRICLDEAQMVLTDASYRESLRQVRQVRRLRVPFVALTATLPPAKEKDLAEALFMDRPLLLRRSVDRPNLQYAVLAQPELAESGVREMDLLEAAVWLVRKVGTPDPDEDERTICYVKTKALVEQLAEMLGCAAYHAEVTDRETVYRDWVDGRQRIIVGTNAIGAGVDFPRVCTVVHVGSPDGMMAYSQEAGRAGRDGRLASCLILLPHVPQPAEAHTETVDGDRAAMRQFLSTKECRRRTLTAFLDGGDGVDCGATPAHQPCDQCVVVRATVPTVTVDAGDVTAGDRLARRATKQQEADRRWYLNELRRWADRCIICLGDRPTKDWKHAPCSANKLAVSLYQRERRRIQLPSGIGCFRCANPDWACDREGAAGQCQRNDQVLLLCHGIIRARAKCTRAGEIWQAVAPKKSGRWAERQCWEWLSRKTDLYGAPAFNANLLVTRLMSQLPS